MLRVIFGIFGKILKIFLIVMVVGGVIGGISLGVLTAGGVAVQHIDGVSAADVPDVSASDSANGGEKTATTEPTVDGNSAEDNSPTESPDSKTTPTATLNRSKQDAEPMPPVYQNDSLVPAYPPRITKSWDREYWPNEDDPRHIIVTTSNGTEVNTEDVERYVITYINRYRSNHSLNTWKYSRVLASTSRAHGYDMAVNDYLSHENLQGERPWDRFDPGNCSTSYGENIAQTWLDRVTYRPNGSRTTYYTERELGKAIVQQWQESPPHNKLLLMNGFDAAGVGIYLENTERGWRVFATLNVCTFDENESPDGSKAG